MSRWHIPCFQDVMNQRSAYLELLQRLKKLALLHSCSSLLNWDKETYMPSGGAEHRSEQLSLLAGICHENLIAPEIDELLSTLENSTFTDDPLREEAVNIRETRRLRERAVRVPKSLVEDLARAEDDALERRGGAHGVTNGPRQPPTARGGKRREREKKIKEKKTAGKLGNDSRARCPCWQSPRWGRAKRAGSASPGPSRQGWTWRQNMPSSGQVSQRAAGSAPVPSPRRHQRRRRTTPGTAGSG
mgnify:CR=1 FL=1